jgi:hypothetical protein
LIISKLIQKSSTGVSTLGSFIDSPALTVYSSPYRKIRSLMQSNLFFISYKNNAASQDLIEHKVSGIQAKQTLFGKESKEGLITNCR